MSNGSATTDLLDSYKTWLTLGGRKKVTVSSHLHQLKVVLPNSDVATDGDFALWFSQMVLKGYSSSHLNNLLFSARVFCKFLESKGLPYDKTIFEIKKIKDRYKQKATMSDKGVVPTTS